MTTGVAGSQARNQARQVPNTFRKQFNWNDSGNGVNQAALQIPQGAFLVRALLEIVTAFDGGASIIFGSGAGANDIIAAGDVNEAAVGVYDVTRGLGRAIAAAADTTLYSRLTSVAGTVGQAELVLIYEGNNG